MKGKIVLALAAAAVAVVASGPVNAGCNPTKEFYTAYLGAGNNFINFGAGLDISPATVIGRVWQAGSRTTTGDQLNCADDTWLIQPDAGLPQLAIYGSNGGDFGGGTCDTGCFVGPIVVVVATKSLDGTSASYAVGKVTENPPNNFDFSRSGTDWTMVPVPKVQVTNSSRTATDITVDVVLDGPGPAFNSPSADAFTSTGTITAYQLVSFIGVADPGRGAALWAVAVGTPIVTTSPSRAGVTGACPSGSSLFLANRPVIDGGQFSGDYVSASTRISCSNIAMPGAPKVKPIGKKSIAETNGVKR